MVTDSRNRIVEVNPAFTEITGYALEDVIGQTPNILSSGRQSGEFYADLWSTLHQQDHWRGEVWNRRKDGEIYAEMLSIAVVRDQQGQLLNYLGFFSDISSTKAHQEELHQIAHYDILTGVPNRRLLGDRMHQAIAGCKRSGKSVAVCYLDLDNFKPVNDTYGHATGDQLLIEITRRLHSVLREVDTLARLGGDEFVLLLSELTDGDHCFKVLDRVLAMVSAPIRIENVTVAVSASIGVTVYPGDEADADTLLRHADQAMYQAKQEGRNRYRLFDPEGERRRHAEHQLLAQLSEALEKAQFSLHYQPKVHLQTGQVVGLEALIRWQHPDRGLMAPAGFLGHLMGSDLETAVGLWVIENAVGQFSAWRQAMALPGMGLSVNISPRQLMAEDFLQQIDHVLKSHPGVDHGDLELEIQESTALLDMERAAEVVRAGQKLGCRFSFDDFGTGGFSLANFRRLPVNSLKIDRSFVEQMDTSASHLDIVESIIGLGKAFAMDVVAEGVETPEQRLQLLAMGCPLGQGYGIARPMPALEFQAWLECWNRANF